MSEIIFLALLVVVGCAVPIGVFGFFAWAVWYFVGRSYRIGTRSHLYVPVRAQVFQVEHGDDATVHVHYDWNGVRLVNRFAASAAVGQLAAQLKQIALRIDPENPKDLVVDPAFVKQATDAFELRGEQTRSLGAQLRSWYKLSMTAYDLPGSRIWFGPGTVSGTLFRVLLIVFLFVGYCISWWPEVFGLRRDGGVPTLLLVSLAVLLAIWLIHSTWLVPESLQLEAESETPKPSAKSETNTDPAKP